MPFPPRQKGSRKSSRGGEEEYVVFLQGIPPQCRWQELKDLVRQTAHHIRQAVVYDDCHGRPTGLGQIIVKNEDEAWRTYNRLSTNGWDGHSLTVTLSLARAPTKPIAGPTRSPSAMRRHHSYTRGYSSPPSATPSVSSPSPSSSPEKHMMASQSYQWIPEYNSFVTNFAPGYQPLAHDTDHSMAYVVPLVFNNKGPMAFPPPAAHHDAYSHPILPYATPNVQPPHENSPNNMASRNYRNGSFQSCNSSSSSNRSNRSSVSTASGTSIQPCCSIFIQNLKPNVTWQNLREYLRAAGVVERCEVYNDQSSGRPSSSGNAKATFPSTEEAQKAVTLFDNSYFWGSRIRVIFGESPAPGFTNGYNNNNSSAGISAGHELLAGSMNGMTINDVAGEKAKPNEPLVVNGSSVGTKTDRSCQRGQHPTSHLVQESRTVWSH